MNTVAALLGGAFALTLGTTALRAQTGARPPYPRSRTASVVDTLHGFPVADPYRWLEAADSPETRAWIDEQNAYTHGVLDSVPGRAALRARLRQLITIGTIGAPLPRRGQYFYTRREGEQNQPILYVRRGLRGRDRPLVDPNRLIADATIALDWWYPSWDGRYVAYGLSEAGSERSTLHVLEVSSGRALPDTIRHTRAASVAWLPDGSGFYYTRYPAPGTVPAGEEVYRRRVYFHRLGTDPARDSLVFSRDEAPQDWPGVSLSPDGRWLLVSVSRGWDKTDLYLADRRAGGPLRPVAEGQDALFAGEVVEGRLYLLTNLEAPNYRLFAVDPSRPEREHWRQIVPERADMVLDGARVVGRRLFLSYLRNASSRLEMATLDGEPLGEVALPTLGSAGGVSGEWDGREAFFGFTSFAVPPAVYRVALPSGRLELWQRVEASVEPDSFEVRQVWYPSRDGTRISMFIVHRRGLRQGGDNPTVLTGYGGFNISMTPSFSRSMYLWLERGGVYALPNLRGGGEYGERWHRAGMLGNKQNVFDDFIAAAEWLIANRYTRPERLAISGGSNGGLLTGAALTQRPELFRAAVVAVPLLDMLRYHRFQIARLWIPEYGSAEDSAQFRWLYAYSPYQRVRDGVAYPAVLRTAAESDSRVDPLHARKMAARLQAANSSGRPVLLRVETRAGHGAGKPVSKQVEEAVDYWSFVFSSLELSP